MYIKGDKLVCIYATNSTTKLGKLYTFTMYNNPSTRWGVYIKEVPHATFVNTKFVSLYDILDRRIL